MKLKLALMLAVATPVPVLAASDGAAPAQTRPVGPCDIYGDAGTPCVAAHSTTRALYAAYDGPLYQVTRRSDGQTLDIGVVREGVGGYADAAVQDRFCAGTLCEITIIYDQSGKGNHLRRAAPGTFKGQEEGGFDAVPIADMAPVTIMGHKAYGAFFMPGMGMRVNDTHGIAVDDEPEGIYYIVDGTHYDSGCCFDYGNASTNGRAVGTGTMETTYFGTSTVWGSGKGAGPWIMSDLEAGLFSGYNAKKNDVPSFAGWGFVTAMVDAGGGNHWTLRGGNAQQGDLTTFYDGVRPGSRDNAAYFPMHKKGGVLLGTGGDNGNGSSGTFYEGVMTRGYPTIATGDAVQANVLAARYDVPALRFSRLTGFTPGATQDLVASFTNTSGQVVTGLSFELAAPAGWSVKGETTFAAPVAAGASVTATFRVTAPAATSTGVLTATAAWAGQRRESTEVRLRSAPAIKINEMRFAAGGKQGNQFIELYNASARPVDLSGWHLVHTPSQAAAFTLATIPAGTVLPSHGFYLLGLANSGLAAPVGAGEERITLRSVNGLAPGQRIDIAGESHTIKSVGTAAAPATMMFVPVSTGPWLTLPPGANSIPVENVAGFAVGEAIGIGSGDHYDLARVTSVGRPSTQTDLVGETPAGATAIRLLAAGHVTAGDVLTIDTGEHKETVVVRQVGASDPAGTPVDLSAPLRFAHRTGIDVSTPGSGIGFAPATRFAHRSGESVQALGSGVLLAEPLARPQALAVPVRSAAAAAEGYQGPAPALWFGGAMSPGAGSLVLLDPSGKVPVDAVVYGTKQSDSSANGAITSPELAVLEGDQRGGGCMALSPVASTRFGITLDTTDRSIARFPDGADSDSNCHDFHSQPATTLGMAAANGSTNVKVASVADSREGQAITIGSGTEAEKVMVAQVGTAGAAATTVPTAAGATRLAVTGAAGFVAGQAIVVGNGPDQERAVVASTLGGRNGAWVLVEAPLTRAWPGGTAVTGTGITLASPLRHDHARAVPLAADAPTPGAPNTDVSRP
jgi:hypothetical protein